MFSTALKLRSVTSKIPKAPTHSDAKRDESEDDGRASSPKRRNGNEKKLPLWRRRKLNKKRCAVTWLIILALGAIAGVLVYYFNYVQYAEYYEYGLMKLNSIGTIDPDWVYWNEWVTRGPTWGMIVYPATAQIATLRNLSVGTRDELGIRLSVTFQYYLRRWDIPALHRTFRLNFSRPVIDRALDAIKETTPKFDSRKFITDRTSVEASISDAVRWRLEGECCLRDCGRNDTRPCKGGCKSRDSCQATDMGVYVEVKHFYLLETVFPASLQQAFLNTIVTNVSLESVTYDSESLKIRAETDLLVAQIRLEEERISKTAEIQSNLTLSIAKSKYLTVVRGARAKALDTLCNELNITAEELKNSLEYSQILAEANSVHMNVDYQPLFVKFRNP